MQDPIFAEEQAHLTHTFQTLQSMGKTLTKQLQQTEDDAAQTKNTMSEELTLNVATWDDAMESYADISSMNRIIDSLNIAHSATTEKLAAVTTLLPQPYFAKISLQFKPDEEPTDLYLGKVGISDENYQRLVVDWRSPVAEVYYNQHEGRTSYTAHGRTIPVTLKLRRQFDLAFDQLNAYFDTTVALQDSLLIASLSQQRTAHMQAITATIQQEQNAVVRHEDVPALLVNGIAGSGKTSVLLQRIAYLFYQQRKTLTPEEVFLITPNPLFQTYIEHVLPELGEKNPEILTWDEFFTSLLPLGRQQERTTAPLEQLWQIDEAVQTCTFETRDYHDIMQGDECLFSAAQIKKIADRFAHIPAGPHLVTLMREELLKRLESRLKQRSKTERVHNELSALSLDEQLELFHETIEPQTEEEYAELSLIYLKHKYAAVQNAIGQDSWLRIDRIGMRILGVENLSSTAWLYLKMALTGMGNPTAQYVMIDEVQDYTADQIAVLARYFRRANFLLLGDAHQAIKPHTVSYAELTEVMTRLRGSLDECHLMTSYRSSPEITELFAGLLSPAERGRISSVQPAQGAPEFILCASKEQHNQRLQDVIKQACEQQAHNQQGLCAVIVPWKKHLHELASELKNWGEWAESNITVVTEASGLPESGVVLITLALAKGLEFDQVIIPFADAGTFPDTPLGRNCLYTTISRATKRVTLLACADNERNDGNDRDGEESEDGRNDKNNGGGENNRNDKNNGGGENNRNGGFSELLTEAIAQSESAQEAIVRSDNAQNGESS